jgi:hypothetical protein
MTQALRITVEHYSRGGNNSPCGGIYMLQWAPKLPLVTGRPGEYN